MNTERITKIYSDLDRFFTDLKEVKITQKSDLEDKLKFHAVSMMLFSILNRTIDLGEEIIVVKQLPLPDSHKSVFEILAKEKIIVKEEEEKLKFMVNFRNLIAHQYYAFDENDIYEVYSNLNIVTRFIDKSKKLFKEKSSI